MKSPQGLPKARQVPELYGPRPPFHGSPEASVSFRYLRFEKSEAWNVELIPVYVLRHTPDNPVKGRPR